MKVTFETEDGRKYEVTPAQMCLTQVGTHTAALTIPVDGKTVEVKTWACVLTLEGQP